MSEGNYVYVISFSDLDHKIGFSNNPWRRIAELPGAIRVVKVWPCPAADGQMVESLAHRVLAEWRREIPSARERFNVSEAAACLAVELAIALRQDEALAASARAVQAALAEKYREMAASAAAGHGLRIGYVCGASASAAVAEADAVVSAGADPGRVYVDIGRPSQSLRAAIKAVRGGDTIVIAAPDRLDGLSRKTLAAKSVSIMEVCQ